MTAPGIRRSQHSSREAFDATALYDRLNTERQTRGNISWRELSRQAHIATGGIGRELAEGRLPTAGLLAKLLLWLGDTDIAPYIRADYRESLKV